ncbi:MAG: LD-carboxypeptidase [Deltaproteobacteria bacterium]|jgi:muramoyltetrapeptide carboxypeptidase|nr:LD-carboxypeptidase [Deltaproteobacteria bacterium]
MVKSPRKKSEAVYCHPVFLPKNAFIGLIAPAGPVVEENIYEWLKIFTDPDINFHPPMYPCEPVHGYLANSDKVRLEGLLEEVKVFLPDALLAIRGGYGCMRLLQDLKNHWRSIPPKLPIIGFSDITALHLARFALTSIGGWHAATLNAINRQGLIWGENDFKVIFGGSTAGWNFERDQILYAGEAIGPLMGGNLTLLSQLWGSEFCPSLSGYLVLLEDTDEAPYAIDRNLTALALKGAWEGVLGVVFGEFTNCSEPEMLVEVFGEFAQRLRVPVAMGAPFGHGKRNSPWFYGEKGILKLEEISHLNEKTKLKKGTLTFPWREAGDLSKI